MSVRMLTKTQVQTQIEARFSYAELSAFGATAAAQERVLSDKLAAVGIPVKGLFKFEGVRRGNLKVEANHQDAWILFKWQA